MRRAVLLVVVAACHHAPHAQVDAPVFTGDASIDARNMCENTPGVLLAPRVDVPTGVGPFGIAVADFNGDALPDLAIATQQPGGATILLSSAPGCMASFQMGLDITTQPNVHGVVTTDFDGDGKPDLAAVSQIQDLVTVMLDTTPTGSTLATFGPQAEFPVGVNPSWVAAGDLSGDGKPDLVTCAPDAVSVLVNTTAPGAMMATFAAKLDLPHTGTTFGLALADLDGDGKLDIVVVDTDANTVSIFPNMSGGLPAFANPVAIPTGMSPFAVAAGDLDGDLKPDLVVANITADTVSILINTTPAGATTPTFAPKIDLPTGMRPYAVAIGDVNRDGKRDIVVADEGSNAISILLALGDGFAEKIDVPVGTSPHGVHLADLDGDNAVDIVVSNGDDAMISVLLAR